jgi:hypothetical protein
MPVRRDTLVTASLVVAACLVATAAAPAIAAPPASDPREIRFEVADVNATGLTTWTVPANICAIDIEAAGGNGGGSWVTGVRPDNAVPGRGAIVTTRLDVVPGEQFTIAVGAAGGLRSGGAPGGGPSSTSHNGGGGGGWSGAAAGSAPDQSNVVLVAAGGGGAGNSDGAHGGDAGAAGAAVALAGAGQAGTEVAGGAGGDGATDGAPGTALNGGLGVNGGGGGGAGYFGGGGGSVYLENGAGGGGSSFPFAGSPDRVSYALKTATDPRDGWVVIRFDAADPADTCGTPEAQGALAGGGALEGATLDPGDGFTLTGTEWGAGEQLTVTFESVPVVLGTITTAADGTFSFSGRVPDAAGAGAHAIVITPAASTLPTVSFGVTVRAVLAATGADVGWAPVAALGLLALGALLVLGRRAAARARLEA